jgi:hypothetical protein
VQEGKVLDKKSGTAYRRSKWTVRTGQFSIMMKEILKVLVTLAVGAGGLWTLGFIRVGPTATLLCKGTMVSLPDPDNTNLKHPVDRIVQIGLISITVDTMNFYIKHDNEVKVEYDDRWTDRDGDWSLMTGWVNRTNGDSELTFLYGGPKTKTHGSRYALKCSKAPEKIF